ncbi:MAG: TIGR03085 family metal-binding protein [Frankia sp.]
MAGYARDERRALCDLLDQVGPDAPTLCAGWTTYDLAAHLVTRDRVPSAGPGLIIPAFHGRTERAERAQRAAHPYPRLVEMVREGVPRWHPARLGVVDETVNLVEFAIHHEDVRRAVGMRPARRLPAAEADALWRRVKMMGKVGFRRLDVGVRAERSDVDNSDRTVRGASPDVAEVDTSGRQLQLRRGAPVVTLYGAPLELLMFSFGRQEAADVELRGDAAAIAALTAARIGP